MAISVDESRYNDHSPLPTRATLTSGKVEVFQSVYTFPLQLCVPIISRYFTTFMLSLIHI